MRRITTVGSSGGAANPTNAMDSNPGLNRRGYYGGKNNEISGRTTRTVDSRIRMIAHPQTALASVDGKRKHGTRNVH